MSSFGSGRGLRARVEEESLATLSKPLRTRRQLTDLAKIERSPDHTYRFAVLGDAEPGRFWFSRRLFNIPGVFLRQLQDIQRHPVDFTMQLGDMVSRGTLRNYRRFFRQLQLIELERPYLTVIGNHDRHDPHSRSNSDFYRSCFGTTHYRFDHGGVRFVVLDSSCQGLSSKQLHWLDMALKTHLRKVVFTHIPPATLRCWTDFAGTRGTGGFRQGAERFCEILSDHHVDRVYVGHIHGFGVQDFWGVRYVLSGGGGSPLFPSGVKDRFHHYIIVTVSSHGLSERVYSLDGTSFEIPSGKVLVSH